MQKNDIGWLEMVTLGIIFGALFMLIMGMYGIRSGQTENTASKFTSWVMNIES